MFNPQTFFISPISSALVFSIMVLGVYVAFRILDVADLSIEGIVPFTTVFTFVLINRELPIWIILLIAIAIGALAGVLNAVLHLYLKIPPLLAGIIVMSIFVGLGTVLRNVFPADNSIPDNTQTVFAWLKAILDGMGLNYFWSYNLSQIIVLLFANAICFSLVYLFFGTQLGVAIRAVGKNKQMSRANGISITTSTIIGMALSSALVALSACLYCQKTWSANPTDGNGTIVLCLSTIFLGEVLFSKRSFKMSLIGVIIGSFAYWYLLQLLFTFIDTRYAAPQLLRGGILLAVLALSYGLKVWKDRLAKKTRSSGKGEPHA